MGPISEQVNFQANGLVFGGKLKMSLLLGETDKARDAFQKGLQALDKTGDRGYWAMAAKASCHLGLSQRNEGLAALRQILALNPEPAALDSIWRGLVRLHRGLSGTDDELAAWAQGLGRKMREPL